MTPPDRENSENPPTSPTPPTAGARGPGVTRLAPSPTGALHVGNARTFLINWCMARAAGWRVVLRIEDLDTPRVKPGVIADTVEILRWLGLDWDEGPILQSADPEPYRDALRTLVKRGLVYPCALSRAEIEAAAAAPNEGDRELRFTPSLRPPMGVLGPAPGGASNEPTNWRLQVDDGRVTIEDRFRGRVELNIAQSVGDFVVWTKQDCPSYQLAVVVDDARQGVTEVVRGDDLLDSAGRQTLVYRALGLGEPPAYTHLPLVRGADGKRLAKRHGSTRLDALRDRGVPSGRVLALLARWCGVDVGGGGESVRAGDLIGAVRLDTIPRHDITLTPEDEAWLTTWGGP